MPSPRDSVGGGSTRNVPLMGPFYIFGLSQRDRPLVGGGATCAKSWTVGRYKIQKNHCFTMFPCKVHFKMSLYKYYVGHVSIKMYHHAYPGGIVPISQGSALSLYSFRSRATSWVTPTPVECNRVMEIVRMKIIGAGR